MKLDFDKLRKTMVEEQIIARGISNELVLEAMRKIPRHLFIPKIFESESYNDYPVEIGYGQTISQPYIVALMTELLEPKPEHKILEIGTGSGYQTAILASIVKEVYTIERIKELHKSSMKILSELGFNNIYFKLGNGYHGWAEAAPFDGIIVTACAPYVPEELIKQLKINSHLIIPVGNYFQELYRITKINENKYDEKSVIPVRFIPLIDDDK